MNVEEYLDLEEYYYKIRAANLPKIAELHGELNEIEKRLNAHKKELVIFLRRKGMSYDEIIGLLHMGKTTVMKICQKAGRGKNE
jgi:DNA invertase Pin-like site-specific DNA recombinase